MEGDKDSCIEESKILSATKREDFFGLAELLSVSEKRFFD
jgi:hypothetical protein